jgi:hypothetical protein
MAAADLDVAGAPYLAYLDDEIGQRARTAEEADPPLFLRCKGGTDAPVIDVAGEDSAGSAAPLRHP